MLNQHFFQTHLKKSIQGDVFGKDFNKQTPTIVLHRTKSHTPESTATYLKVSLPSQRPILKTLICLSNILFPSAVQKT